MENVAKSISQQSVTVMALLGLAVVVLTVAMVVVARRLRALQARLHTLLNEASGDSLERQLDEHFHERIEFDVVGQH